MVVVQVYYGQFMKELVEIQVSETLSVVWYSGTVTFQRVTTQWFYELKMDNIMNLGVHHIKLCLYKGYDSFVKDMQSTNSLVDLYFSINS